MTSFRFRSVTARSPSFTALTMRFGLCLSALLWVGSVSAGLFDDEEARRAILDLRQRLEVVRQEADKKIVDETRRATDDSAQLRRSLLDLQNQIEVLRGDVARTTGLNEQLTRDMADNRRQLAEMQRQFAEIQRQQKDVTQGVDERLRKFEPVKVSVDGREFAAEPLEKRDFEAALAIFRKGDFAASQIAFVDFLKRFPLSGYGASALFWLGNAQYATRDYKEAVTNFRSLLSLSPDHVRAPEAVLSIANCQVELKDTRAARKTLEDLLKAYPQSEAAGAAKERLARLK
jgi:tol-pal system protein YbgF